MRVSIKTIREDPPRELGTVAVVNGQLVAEGERWVRELIKGPVRFLDEMATRDEPERFIEVLLMHLSGTTVRAETVEE